jgi:hypothetical protein
VVSIVDFAFKNREGTANETAFDHYFYLVPLGHSAVQDTKSTWIRLLTILVVLCVGVFGFDKAYAAIYTINASQSQTAIQSIISSALPGDTVEFAAGLYPVTSSLYLACGVTYVGPNNHLQANGQPYPATAELSAPSMTGEFPIMWASGCNALTVSWLHFNNGGGLHLDIPGNQVAGAGGIEITNNLFTGLPATRTASRSLTTISIKSIG